MKTITKTIAAIAMILCCAQTFAQLTVDAGSTTGVCPGSSVQLTATASGGQPPYTYQWSPQATLNTPAVYDPMASPVADTRYYVTVTDNALNTAVDSVWVYVLNVPQIDAGPDISGCRNNQFQLGVTVSDMYNLVFPACSGTLPTAVIGNDTFIYTDPIAQKPSLLGNYYKSYRNQMLYTAAELSATLGTTRLISKVDFKIANLGFNSNASLQNYTIKIGSTNQDSLVSWDNTLNTVYANHGTYQPISGWNSFQLDSGFLWDGASNLIVEVLQYNSNTFGNQPNETECSYTAFKGYVYDFANTNLAGGSGAALTSYLRPNIRLGYCAPPFTLYTFNWSPSVGLSNPNVSNPLVSPLVNTSYIVNVTDLNGCTSQDIVNVILGSGPVLDSLVTTNVLCNAASTGSICAYLSQGNAPYYFSWSNGVSNLSCLSGLVTGIYDVTVTDAMGCMTHDSVYISEPAPLTLSSNQTDLLCNGEANGSIDLTVSGGIPIYTYNWSNAAIAEDLNSIPAGIYAVTVTDAHGCTLSQSFMLTEPTAIQLNAANIINATCFGASNGSACIQATGGAGAYTFMWNTPPFQSVSCATNLTAGTYSIEVTDANACSATISVSITEPAPITAHLVSSTGGSIPDTLTTIYTGGNPPYTFTGSNSTTVPVMYIDSFGLGSCFSASVVDANGCVAFTDTVCYVCTNQCVWPGDADDNGIADNNDLLSIGLGYSTNGPARAQVNIGWFGHNATNWLDTLPDATNYKHLDCDGNGTINANDTTAIIQNFGLTHAKTNEQKPWRMSDPALYVNLVPDTARAGDTMIANLILGDINIPASNVYGLAFTVNYDANVVDTLKTRAVFGSSWLGTATDKIAIAKDLSETGQIKCAITRIDHAARSGNGQIGQVSFVITTDNINGKNLAYYGVDVWISDLVVIDNSGNVIPVNEGRDSNVVEFEPLSVGEMQINPGSLKMYPNPATDRVQLMVTNNLLGAEIKLTDLNGRILKSVLVNATNLTINTTEYDSGVYLVQLVSNQGMITKRLVLTR